VSRASSIHRRHRRRTRNGFAKLAASSRSPALAFAATGDTGRASERTRWLHLRQELAPKPRASGRNPKELSHPDTRRSTEALRPECASDDSHCKQREDIRVTMAGPTGRPERDDSTRQAQAP
jgi:hypothetical protein